MPVKHVRMNLFHFFNTGESPAKWDLDVFKPIMNSVIFFHRSLTNKRLTKYGVSLKILIIVFSRITKVSGNFTAFYFI